MSRATLRLSTPKPPTVGPRSGAEISRSARRSSLSISVQDSGIIRPSTAMEVPGRSLLAGSGHGSSDPAQSPEAHAQPPPVHRQRGLPHGATYDIGNRERCVRGRFRLERPGDRHDRRTAGCCHGRLGLFGAGAIAGREPAPVDGHPVRGERLLQHGASHGRRGLASVVRALRIVELHDDDELRVLGREQAGEGRGVLALDVAAVREPNRRAGLPQHPVARELRSRSGAAFGQPPRAAARATAQRPPALITRRTGSGECRYRTFPFGSCTSRTRVGQSSTPSLAMAP